MRIGTKSVFIGAHQILIHPAAVFLAWHELYGWPTWEEAVCIFVHDLGYIGKKNIDGGPTQLPDGSYDYEEGCYHPVWAALFAGDWLDIDPEIEWSLGGCDMTSNDWWRRDPEWRDRVVTKKTNHYWSDLCLYHSRSTAKQYGKEPSKLCWADKLSVKFDPWWLYLPRVILSGEIHEFRALAAKFGEVPLSASNKEWYKWAQERMIRKAYSKDDRPAYTEGS